MADIAAYFGRTLHEGLSGELIPCASKEVRRCLLRRDEITKLLTADHNNRDDVGRRAIFRIWPDYVIRPQIDLSCSTIKVDAASRTYAASGADSSTLMRALQYDREMNSWGRNLQIHGVNLSLGCRWLPEDYAAGQSPLCRELNLLVGTGVVAVVSAGNSGSASGGEAESGGQELHGLLARHPEVAWAAISAAALGGSG